MDKKVLDTITDANVRLVVSKIIDTANLAAKYHEPRFSHFLDPAMVCVARERLRFDTGVEITYWGGYPEAERQMICAAPDWMDGEKIEFPIALFRVTGYGLEELSHRDYLGSLMGLGIEREVVGDIVADSDAGYLFVCEEMARYVELNLERVGRTAVKLERIPAAEFIGSQIKTESVRISVMSLRLDAILAAIINLSRSKAADLVKAGRVQVNYRECTNLSEVLETDDLISVRGFGKFRIGEVGGISKKGRTFLEIEKFI